MQLLKENEIIKKLNESEDDKKRTWTVTIEETVDQDFEVEASSMEEAEDIAREKYHNGEFVLEPGELTACQLMAQCEEIGEYGDWVEM